MARLYVFFYKKHLVLHNDFVSLLFNIEKGNHVKETVIHIIRVITRSGATS